MQKRLQGRRMRMGGAESGVVYEQELETRNPAEPDPERALLRVRRIALERDEPPRDGETVLHLIRDKPADRADAFTLAERRSCSSSLLHGDADDPRKPRGRTVEHEHEAE